MENFIDIKNLTVAYGNKEVLHHVDLKIDKGMFGLLGRNGAGKTTLMKSIIGLLPIQSGSINLCNINNNNLKELRGAIGYLPQEFDLYPNMRVIEVLEYMGVLSGMSKNKIEDEVPLVLSAVNMQMHKRKKSKPYLVA